MGTIGAAVNGAAFPVYSIIFSDMLSDMLMLTSTALSNAATKWALIFLGFVRFGVDLGRRGAERPDRADATSHTRAGAGGRACLIRRSSWRWPTTCKTPCTASLGSA